MASSEFLQELTSEAGNLSEKDLELMGRLLGSPADFPPALKGWIRDYIQQEVVPAIVGRQIKGATTGSAPTTASYVTVNSNSVLENERTLTAGTEIDVVDGGANSPITISREPIPFCHVKHNADQTISDATPTELAFNTETSDTLAMHSNVTNNTRITVPAAGVYLIVVFVEWAANATGVRTTTVRLNGTTSLDAETIDPSSTTTDSLRLTIVRRLAANDYLEARVEQTSGGNLDVKSNTSSPTFQVTWLGA